MDTGLLALYTASSIFVQILVIIFVLLIVVGIPNIQNIRGLFKKIKKEKKDYNHHTGCKYRGDKYYYETVRPLLVEAVESSFAIWEIREKVLIEEQLSATEKTLIKIKSMLMKEYAKMNPPSKDLRYYSKILDYTLSQTKEKLREFIKANHLTEKSEHEYSEYVRQTASVLQEHHVSILDQEYWTEDFKISREDLYKQNKENNMNIILDMVEELLFDLRKISRRNMDKAKKLEDDLFS